MPAINDLKPHVKSASTSINLINGEFKLQHRAPRNTRRPPESLKFLIAGIFSICKSLSNSRFDIFNLGIGPIGFHKPKINYMVTLGRCQGCNKQRVLFN